MIAYIYNSVFHVYQMEHDGFQKAEDKIQPTPIRMVAPPGNLSSGSPMMVDTSTSEMKPPEIASVQTSQVSFAAVANAIGPMNSSQHPSSNARMMAAVNNSQTGNFAGLSDRGFHVC